MKKEIEITNEMIEAGINAYEEMGWDEKFSDIISSSNCERSRLVSKVFRAMAEAASYTPANVNSPIEK